MVVNPKLWFAPNITIDRRNEAIMVVFQVVLFLSIWSLSNFPFLPSPAEIAVSWWRLVSEYDMLIELSTSLLLNFTAIGLTLLLSLAIGYASVMPFFRKIAQLYSKFRFNGVVGLTLFFAFLTSTTYQLKLSILVFSMSVWFTTSLLEEVRSIPQEEYEHARTIGLGRWRTVWEVTILSRLDRVFEVLRQNAAIGWLMLTTVEGLVRSEGGIGVLLLQQNKYLRISEVLALQLTILVVGVGQDFWWGFLRKKLFPYADMGVDKR